MPSGPFYLFYVSTFLLVLDDPGLSMLLLGSPILWSLIMCSSYASVLPPTKSLTSFSLLTLFYFSVLALTTRSVEFSLTFSVFVGACMVAGNVKDGFKMTFERFILLALADLYHGYVYLFTMFLSGLVGMLEKSGGMKVCIIDR